MAGDIHGVTNLSNLSLAGTLSASTVTVPGLVSANTVWASTVSIGGFNLPTISSTSSLVAPFVVQGSASSFTIITWAAALPGDHIIVSPLIGATVSSMSSGLVAHSHCTQAGQVEFRLSNVSTLAQNQSTRSWVFTSIRPF
jgi:hypothetical protein